MIIQLDGAMGTQLQQRGLQPGEIPELWNLTRPDDIVSIHRAYVEAGANIISTNTFGANPAKYHGDAPLKNVIAAAVANARAAGAERVALDVGPTGRLLKPSGDFEFDAAYDAFAEQIRLGAEADADLIFLETFADTYELKAALLAAKENANLPILASVSLSEDGKLLTGADVDTIAALFNALKPDACGFNCGLGPDKLLPFVQRLATRTHIPIIVKANAGLPKVVDGQTVFTVGPEAFAKDIAACIAAGATYVGGCCGTTPRHIAAVRNIVLRCVSPAAGNSNLKIHPSDDGCLVTPRARTHRGTTLPTVVSSYSRTVELPLNDSLVIGERINPTGKKKLREAYKAGDMGYILREAIAQVEAGAPILDVNAGVPGIDEPKVLRETVEAIQSITDTPLQIDTSDPVALENALRHYNGKAMINSVNAKEEVMNAVFPIVAKYGGVLVALTLDENGIPPTVEGRLALAKKMIAHGAEYGLTKDDFVIDVLCLAMSADPTSVPVILESLRRIRAELGVRTVLGVSNISFGLPARPLLNATFYSLALEAGLTSAIINPLSVEMMTAYKSWRALTGRDPACGEWIKAVETGSVGGSASPVPRCVSPAALTQPTTASNLETPQAGTHCGTGLTSAIIHGLRADAAQLSRDALAAGTTPIALIDGEIVPALEIVGKGFESGKLFLPQLLMAAEAASAAFEVIRAALEQSGSAAEPKGPILIATVKGDIHDIGKNIVRALLENYGFRVIDMGKDVEPEAIVAKALETKCKLVGLSALMTTTVVYMKETIEKLNAADPSIKTFVGGAVMTPEYASEIHATYYAKDAMASVRLAEEFFK